MSSRNVQAKVYSGDDQPVSPGQCGCAVQIIYGLVSSQVMVCRKMHPALESAQSQVRGYNFKQVIPVVDSSSVLFTRRFVPVRSDSPVHNLEASGKDFKLMLIEKENTPVHKETERLVMTKDSGKQFMVAAPASGLGNT